MRKYLYQLIVSAFAALTIMLPATAAAQSEIPALVRTVIPSGDASGGRIAYAIPLGDSRTLQLSVDAGNLLVTISGQVKDEFKLYTVLSGEFTPLACSSGFLGKLTGRISCAGVEPGTQLVFVRKDVVDELVPQAAEEAVDEFADEEEMIDEIGDEEAGIDEEISEEEALTEEKPSLFDRALDFFGFGEEEEEVSADELTFEADGEAESIFEDAGELVFGEEDEFAFAEEPAEEEPTFIDQVADFFGFGESEEVVEELAEAPVDEFAFEAEGELALGEAGDGLRPTFGGEDLLLSAGEEVEEGIEGEVASEFEGEVFGDEEILEKEDAGAEERLLPRIWREVRETAEAVQYKVADFIAKLYVKPLPLAPEAVEEDVIGDGASIDGGAEFLEAPEAMNDADTAPAATVNEAFQRFINGLGQ